MNSHNAETVPLHQALAKCLAEHGLRTMFGLIGDANLFLVDSFTRHQRGRFVGATHEAGAILMAHGYAQSASTVGIATITHGPGLTNAVTALVEATRSGTPLVVLCGDTPAADLDHLQKINQRELVATTGAGFEQLCTPATALKDLARTIRRARLERRPIVFNMPVDFQWLDIPYENVSIDIPDIHTVPGRSDNLERALATIAGTGRPIILGGRGAVSARDELIDLARRIEAPLATTLRASGLFHGEPNNLGVLGTLSTPVAVDAVLECDCIVSFGASLNPFTTAQGNFLRDKHVVQVDIDAHAIARRTQASLGIVGDCAHVARTLTLRLEEAEIAGKGFFSPDMAAAIQAYRPEPTLSQYNREPAPGTIDLRFALQRIALALPRDLNMATDLGRFVNEAWKAFPVINPNYLIHAASFGAIGVGLASAIGAALPGERPTVLVCGDGGFMMSGFAELHTAVRERLDLIIVVCSDGSYGAEHVQFRNRAMDPATSLFNWPDFTPVAETIGCTAFSVRNKADLEIAAAGLGTRSGPILIDLKLDPDQIPWG